MAMRPQGQAMGSRHAAVVAGPRRPGRGHRLGQGGARVPGRRHRPPADDRGAGLGGGARLPAVGAVPRDDADLPVARLQELAGGRVRGDGPGRLAGTLIAPDLRRVRIGEYTTAWAASSPDQHSVEAQIRRAGPEDAAEVIARIGGAHQAARDAGPLTWDEGPTRQWLSRPDLYSYLAGDDGYAAYRWDADGHANLLVERVHAVTPQSLRALWSVIASHSSVARTVTALTAPNDPFWWLTAERDATISKRSMWMLRVVDAPAAIAARGFPPGVSVSVPLAIHDQARPANAGRWQLTVADGKGALVSAGAVGKTDAAISLGRLPAPIPAAASPAAASARGLAALYGGAPVGTLRLSGLASGGTPDDDAALDAAFAATAYMVDDF